MKLKDIKKKKKTKKGDYLNEAEEILQKELENLKEQLNKIQEKKKLCKSIAKAGK